MSQASFMLEAESVSKSFADHIVIQDFSLRLKGSETIGFVGANGAGKSTLFSLLSGQSDCTSGVIHFLGQILKPENNTLRRKIGYLPQNLGLPPFANGSELLRYAQDLYELEGLNLIEETLAFWDCLSFADKPFIACSHGMQKRIGLALATIHNPPFLILDEPFAGLDILHTRALVQMIKKRSKEQQSTILSCHIIPYLVGLCDQVYCVHKGKITSLDQYPSFDSEQRIKLIEAQF